MPGEMKELVVAIPNYRGLSEVAANQCWLDLWWNFGCRGLRPILIQTTHTTVQNARQEAVNFALSDNRFSHLLYIDDDMTFTGQHYAVLERDAIDADLDFVAGLGFTNSTPTRPCVFAKIPGAEEWGKQPWWTTITDYPKQQLFEVFAAGFGMVLMTTRMLRTMVKECPNGVFLYPEGMMPNEDIAFCVNAQRLGFRLWADSRCSLGHISKERPIIDETIYELQGEALEYTHGMPRVALSGLTGASLHAQLRPQEAAANA